MTINVSAHRSHAARRFAVGVAVVAVVLGVAIGGAALSGILGSIRGDAGAGAGKGATAQFQAGGLAFSHPASWRTTDENVALHYETVLGYLGTGSGSIKCGSDFIPGLGGTCPETIDLAQNSLVVKVAHESGPPTPDGPVAWSLANDPGAVATKIAGQPATVQTLAHAPSGVDEAVMWVIADPASPLASYLVTAYLRGPDVEGLRGQVVAALATATIGK